jgi:arylsulfatase A-like enzyme
MDKSNIVFLVLDDVRADRLSCYGHHRETTPNIDELAENGVLYENAFSTSNWTPSVHATMFSGLLPSHSGVYAQDLNLPPNIELLPEKLNKHGYRTFATSAGAHLRKSRGYDRGMEEFHETYQLPEIWPSVSFFKTFATDSAYRKLAKHALQNGWDHHTTYKFEKMKDWIGTNDNRPFFAFLNCKNAHSPYDPPRPHKERFCPDLKRPWYAVVQKMLEMAGRKPERLPGYDFETLERISNNFPILAGELAPDNDLLDIIRAWYDGSINYMDRRIGELVDFLESNNLMKDTYLVITSDHGELFGEHGLGKHNYSLYDEVLRVPLVIYKPDISGSTRIEEQVSLIDIFPTLLDLANVERADTEFATSLYPFEKRKFHDYTFAEVGKKPVQPIQKYHPEFEDSKYNRPMQVVRDNQYKLIRSIDGELIELYDWREDPKEINNLADELVNKRNDLESVIDEHLFSLNDSTQREEIDDDRLRDTLENLGYL